MTQPVGFVATDSVQLFELSRARLDELQMVWSSG